MVTLDSAGGVGGRVWLIEPPSGLGELVEHGLVESRVEREIPLADSDRIVPDGSGHLLLHVAADGNGRRLSVVGARSVGIEIDKSGRGWTVGLRFRPGAVTRLFGAPAAELTDRSAPLADLLGGRARPGARAALEAEGPAAALRALFAVVRDVATHGSAPDWRVRAIAQLLDESGGRARVDEICDRVGVSPRTLRDVFAREVGVGPKRLARIRRIHGMIRRGKSHPAATGIELAGASGFADEPHMIREAQALLGESPRRFLARGRGPDGRPDTGRHARGRPQRPVRFPRLSRS